MADAAGEPLAAIDRGGPTSREPLVAVADLGKRFAARTALADLSLTTAAGEVCGLVGANGGGKTTALRLLAGLLRPDSGGGRVLGLDLRRDAAGIRGAVGYMSQRASFYADLTVLENLRFRAEVRALPDATGRARATACELGLGDRLDVRAGRLSGGTARRLQLAAALVHAPRLLLLDEPTAGLDAPSRLEVWRTIDRLAAAGAGVVVSTHDLAEAERCTRVALLVAGRVAAYGAPAEIARGTPAAAYLLRGNTRLLAARIDALDGVVATRPDGDGLRVVVHGRSAGDPPPRPLVELARRHGTAAEPVAMRLEDAALAICRPDAGGEP